MIVVEECLTGFQHGHPLTMNGRGVEQECGSGRAFHFKNLRVIHLVILHQTRMLLAMASFDEIERTAAHICQVHGQLDFSVDLFRSVLIVPGVAVPTMKVTFRR